MVLAIVREGACARAFVGEIASGVIAVAEAGDGCVAVEAIVGLGRRARDGRVGVGAGSLGSGHDLAARTVGEAKGEVVGGSCQVVGQAGQPVDVVEVGVGLDAGRREGGVCGPRGRDRLQQDVAGVDREPMRQVGAAPLVRLGDQAPAVIEILHVVAGVGPSDASAVSSLIVLVG